MSWQPPISFRIPIPQNKRRDKPAYQPFTSRKDTCASPYYRFESPRQITPVRAALPEPSRNIYFSNHLPTPVWRSNRDRYTSSPESVKSDSSEELASAEFREMKRKGQSKGRRLGVAQNKVQFGLQIDDLFMKDLSSPTKLHQSARTSPLKTAFKFNKVRSSLLDEIGQVKHMLSKESMHTQTRTESIDFASKNSPANSPKDTPAHSPKNTPLHTPKHSLHQANNQQLLMIIIKKENHFRVEQFTQEQQSILLSKASSQPGGIFNLRGQQISTLNTNTEADNNSDVAIISSISNGSEALHDFWKTIEKNTEVNLSEDSIERLIRYMNSQSTKEELQRMLNDPQRILSIVGMSGDNNINSSNAQRNKNNQEFKVKLFRYNNEKKKKKKKKQEVVDEMASERQFSKDYFDLNKMKVSDQLAQAEKKNMVDMYSKYSNVLLRSLSTQQTKLPQIAPGSLIRSFNGLKMKILQSSFPAIAKQYLPTAQPPPEPSIMMHNGMSPQQLPSQVKSVATISHKILPEIQIAKPF